MDDGNVAGRTMDVMWTDIGVQPGDGEQPDTEVSPGNGVQPDTEVSPGDGVRPDTEAVSYTHLICDGGPSGKYGFGS